jgi:hypothetical protein
MRCRAGLIDKSGGEPRRLRLARAFSRRLIVDCEASGAPVCGRRPTNGQQATDVVDVPTMNSAIDLTRSALPPAGASRNPRMN